MGLALYGEITSTLLEYCHSLVVTPVIFIPKKTSTCMPSITNKVLVEVPRKKKHREPWFNIKISSFQYKKAHYEYKKTQHHIIFTTGFPYWLDNIFILNQGLWLHQTWLILNVQQCRALYWHHPYRTTNVVVKIDNLYRINSLLRTKFVSITNNLWRWDSKK